MSWGEKFEKHFWTILPIKRDSTPMGRDYEKYLGKAQEISLPIKALFAGMGRSEDRGLRKGSAQRSDF